MAERFYVNFALTPGEVLLQGPEAHHLATVMRARAGDRVILFAGDGSEYPATVVEVAKKSVSLLVEKGERPERELPFELEIATAMPKGDRADLLVEKLTELGVTRLVPLKTERSVAQPKTERLIRSVVEASKQCGRNRLMEVEETMEWAEYCRSAESNSVRLFAHASASASLPPCGGGLGWGVAAEVHDASTPHPNPLPQGERGPNIVVAVGPEGGFTDEEVNLAVSANWQTVSLGPRTLRVETAAIAVASYFSLSCTNSKTA